MANITISARTQKFEKFIVYFTLVYVTIFAINALVSGNSEFIYYTAMMILTISVILFIHRRMHFYPIILLSLSILGLFHLLGGNYYVYGIRLYDYWLIPPNIFKYDNFIHTFGSGVMVMLAYAMLKPVLRDPFEQHDNYFIILLVLIGMGLGVINEVIEFIAVLTFKAGNEVGYYTNTLLDLIYNTVGAVIMAIILVKTKIPLVEILPAKKP